MLNVPDVLAMAAWAPTVIALAWRAVCDLDERLVARDAAVWPEGSVWLSRPRKDLVEHLLAHGDEIDQSFVEVLVLSRGNPGEDHAQLAEHRRKYRHDAMVYRA